MARARPYPATHRPGLRRRIVHRIAVWLGPRIHHPGVSVATGIGMLATGVAELAADLVIGFDAIFAAHHGLLLIGTVMALRGGVDLINGLERLDQGIEALDTPEPGDSGCNPPSQS